VTTPVRVAGSGRARRREPAEVPPLLQSAAGWSWRLLVVLAAVLVLATAVSRVRVVVIPVAAALLITALLRPGVTLLGRWLPRVPATWIVLLAFLGAIAGVLVLFGTGVSGEFSSLGTKVQDGLDRVQGYLTDGPFHFSDEQVDRAIDDLQAQFSDNRGSFVSGVITGASLLAEVLAGLLLTIFCTFFFLYDGPRIWAWIVSRFPDDREGRVDAAGRQAWSTLTGYIRGTALVATVDAVGIGAGLLVMGVPLVAPLALLTFFGGFIPIVGATVAGAAAVLVALVTKGTGAAIVILIVVLVVQQLEGHVLQPFVLGRAVRLHPIVIVLSLTAGGVVAGIPGAIIGVPLVAVVTSAAKALSHYDEDVRLQQSPS
jgi:predicted PurR-regulated permease PerM